MVAGDADSDPTTYSIVDQPTHGTLSPLSGNTVTYTPAAGFAATDSFTFKANDGTTDSNTATVAITVGSNRAPVLDAIGDRATDEGHLLSFNVSASDPDGDGMTFSASGLPAGATLNASTGAFSWTPDFQPSRKLSSQLLRDRHALRIQLRGADPSR